MTKKQENLLTVLWDKRDTNELMPEDFGTLRHLEWVHYGYVLKARRKGTIDYLNHQSKIDLNGITAMAR